jgi:hypothetical protein
LLIDSPERSIKVVMHESGFRSKSIFNREFNRHFARNPSEFRDKEAADPVSADVALLVEGIVAPHVQAKEDDITQDAARPLRGQNSELHRRPPDKLE